MVKIILYIHGMGGGGDSRIPSVLNDNINNYYRGEPIQTVVRTYDFDPEVAQRQIKAWVEELNPSLIIGESLGSLNAIRVQNLPHILVSPSLNAPQYLRALAYLSLLPGVPQIFSKIYKPREGDRQELRFVHSVLKKYRRHRVAAIRNTKKSGSKDYYHAFFGKKDHYRKSGIVSVRTYEKYFGSSYTMYPGTHFMENEFIVKLLIPKIIEVLGKQV